MRDSLDQSYVEHWEGMAANGLLRKHYIGKEAPGLALFMDAGDLHALSESLKDGLEPDVDVLRRVLAGSKIGAKLFADLGYKLDYAVFVRTIERKLDDWSSSTSRLRIAGGSRPSWPQRVRIWFATASAASTRSRAASRF